MGGLAKFFFGGIVGALIGIFMSPKRAQQVREALLGASPAPTGRHLTAAPSSQVLSADAIEIEAEPGAADTALEDEAAPIVEMPAVEESAAEEPAAEEPAVIDSVPLPEGAAIEEAVPVAGEEAVFEEPVLEEPAFTEAAFEEPAMAAMQPQEAEVQPQEAEAQPQDVEAPPQPPVPPAPPEEEAVPLIAEEVSPVLTEEPPVVVAATAAEEAQATPPEPPIDAEPVAEPEFVAEQDAADETGEAVLEAEPVEASMTAYSPPAAPEAVFEAQPEASVEPPMWEPATIPLEPAPEQESAAVVPELEAQPVSGMTSVSSNEELPGFESAAPEEPLVGDGVDFLPETLEEAEAGEVLQASTPSAGQPSSRPPVTSPADLKARIEETRRRIRRELAYPFSGDKVESSPASDLFAQQEPPVFAAPEPQPAIDLAPIAEDLEEAPGEVPLAEPPSFGAQEEGYASFADEAMKAYEGATAEVSSEEPVEEEVPASAAEPAEEELPAAAAEPEEPPAAEREPELVAALAGGFDQAAMRRRIEETRNRLKAKAFDAMMSGEGALLRESKSESPEAPVVAIDRDVDQTVESALSEEDEF